KIAVARFTRTLGTLLSSGVPILDALEIVAKTAGNVVVEDGLLYTRAKISEGKNMAEPLGEIAVFPGMVVQMVAVGEQTGALVTSTVYLGGFTLGGFSSLFALITVGLAYALAAIYAVLLRAKRSLTLVARLQLITDQITWTALVYITGGAHSGATSLYGLTCI